MTAEPSVLEFLDLAAAAVKGQADRNSDFLRGSDYESLGVGPNAILFTRQARRDTDLFNACRLHGAQGEDLTHLVKQRYDIDRYLDSHGTGTARLRRATAGAGSGTIWAGTRIGIFGTSLKLYRVTEDTPVGATDLEVRPAIEAMELGPSGAASQSTNLRLEDPIWDTSFEVVSISCDPGTVFESASSLIARIRDNRVAKRVGHEELFKTVCKEQGASQIAIYRSNYDNSSDHGLNVCYVGDAGYYGSPELVRACAIALQSVRVLGDHLQVLPMARVSLDIGANIYLRSAPALFDLGELEQIHYQSIRQYLGGSSGGFTFAKVGLASAIARHTPAVQRVDIVTPSSDVTIKTSGNFPAVLNRYVVDRIRLRYAEGSPGQ